MERTLKALRDGYPLVEKVERWNPHAKCRQDLFGVADVLAIRPGKTLAIQVTDASHATAHEKNLDGHPNVMKVLAAGWRVQVWARYHYKKDGWKPRIIDITCWGTSKKPWLPCFSLRSCA